MWKPIYNAFFGGSVVSSESGEKRAIHESLANESSKTLKWESVDFDVRGQGISIGESIIMGNGLGFNLEMCWATHVFCRKHKNVVELVNAALMIL